MVGGGGVRINTGVRPAFGAIKPQVRPKHGGCTRSSRDSVAVVTVTVTVAVAVAVTITVTVTVAVTVTAPYSDTTVCLALH